MVYTGHSPHQKVRHFCHIIPADSGSCITPLDYEITKLTLRYSHILKLTFMFKVAQSPANRVLCFRNKSGLYRRIKLCKSTLVFSSGDFEKISICDILISISHEAIGCARKNLAILCSCRGLNKIHQNKL